MGKKIEEPKSIWDFVVDGYLKFSLPRLLQRIGRVKKRVLDEYREAIEAEPQARAGGYYERQRGYVSALRKVLNIMDEEGL